MDVPAWYRTRRYLHFDYPTSLEAATRVVSIPASVEKHSFYPFLTFEKKQLKIKKCKTTGALKRTEKIRSICYASHLDSHIYGYYSHQLSNAYEAKLETLPCSESILAFRTLDKSNIGFAAQAFRAIKSMGYATATALDISDFFGSLDHRILKCGWLKLLNLSSLPEDHYRVFRSITKFSTASRDAVFNAVGLPKSARTPKRRICDPEEFRQLIRGGKLIARNGRDAGIPQGSPLSALLSNIYMLDFDIAVHAEVSAVGGKYFRYCDDMLIISPPAQSKNLNDFVCKLIGELNLSIQPLKTETRNFYMRGSIVKCDKPLQYLGLLFDGESCRLRSASLARNAGRMSAGIRLAKATMQSRNGRRAARGRAPTPLHLKQLYRRYSYLGRRNFLSYAFRAVRELSDAGLDSRGIKKQVRSLWGRLKRDVAPA